MKRMFLFCFLIILFSSCGKDNAPKKVSSDNYFLKFKVDGNIVEFKDFIVATKTVKDNQFFVAIQAQMDNVAHIPGLGIFIQDTTDIAEQAYIGSELSSGNALLYSDTTSVNFSSQYTTDPSELEIVITKVDSATVSGTFSSKVADLNANNKLISEGQFCARIQ